MFGDLQGPRAAGEGEKDRMEEMVGAILKGLKGVVNEGNSFTLQKIHSGSGARPVTSTLLLFPQIPVFLEPPQ